MKLTEIFNNIYAKSFLVVLLTACICGYYLPWKWTSFLLVPLYFFAWAERGNYQIEKNLKIAFYALIGYMVLFSLTSYVPKHSFKGVYDVLRGLLLFPVGLAFARWITEKKSWMFVNLIALLLVFGTLFFPQSGGRYYSYFYNPNNAAVLLIVLICFLLPGIERWRPNWLNIFSLLGLPVALYLLFLTNGRGAWLGFACAILVLLFFRCNLGWKVRVPACFIVVASALFLFVYYNWKGFQLSQREGLWSGLLDETFNKYFLFGYGFNGTKDLIDQLGLITRTAHNIILEIFVTSGLFGLLFMMFFVFFLWWTFSRYSYPNNHIVLSGIVAITAFLVMGQFDLKFASFRFAGTLAFFLGMIYSQRIEKGTATVIVESRSA